MTRNALTIPAVTIADIMLVMKSVASHISARRIDEFPALMHVMFPDSTIAKQVQLHRTKVCCGLAPYCKRK